MCVCVFSPSYVALWDSRTPHRLASERVCWFFETSSFKTPFLGRVSIPNSFCLSFCLLYFVLTPFEDNGLPFWVPDVLCQHSEVVLWNLLSVQMFFQWICREEIGLPILFLCHLRTAPLFWHYLWRLSLLYHVTFAALLKISWLFLGSLVYFHWSICVLFSHCCAV